MKKIMVWLTAALLGLALVSCSKTTDDYTKALEKEQKLVSYLQTNFPAYHQAHYQGIASTLYYVPLVEGTGDSPHFDTDYITISYRTWKMENYTNWAPNDADLLNTSDSTESVHKLVIRNYMHGGPELYPLALTFPEFGLALSEMKKGGKIMLYIAPSVASGFTEYTRVMEISLVEIIHASDFDTTQLNMMGAYRASLNVPEDELAFKHLITNSSSAIKISSEDGTSYIIMDPHAGEGDVPYWVEQAGTGDLITNGMILNITSLSYGYLQKGRHASDASLMDYIPVGKNLPFATYEVGKGHETFGDGIDELLKGQRKGVKIHMYMLSKFAFGWTGSVSNPVDASDTEAYSTYMIPPGVPVVFDVTVGF